MKSRASGSYVLLIDLEKTQNISVGALGELRFDQGSYAYVGSALNGVESRVRYHLRKGKRPHWHIDYLLERARIESVLICRSIDRLECRIARELGAEATPVNGFGCSDCHCVSHLFFGATTKVAGEAIARATTATFTLLSSAQLRHNETGYMPFLEPATSGRRAGDPL